MRIANDRQHGSPLTPRPMFAPGHFIREAALDPSPDGRVSIETARRPRGAARVAESARRDPARRDARERAANPVRAVVVTGASSGIGRACTLRLSEAGFLVFAAVRNPRDFEELGREGSERVVPIRLDVTDPETITAAVRTVGERAGAAGLAGLVNNAGIAITGPLEFLPLDDIRRQFEVNVFGQIAVIQAFLPLLRADHGRIINVGSVGARFALPFAGPLNASKAAFELVSDSLRLELRQWGVPVVLVSPAAIRTSAGSKLVRDSESTLQRLSAAGRSLYAAPYRGFVQALHGLEAHGAGPEVMASTVLRAMTARVPRRRYPVGPRSRLLPFLFDTLPAGLADRLRLKIFHVPSRAASAAE